MEQGSSEYTAANSQAPLRSSYYVDRCGLLSCVSKQPSQEQRICFVQNQDLHAISLPASMSTSFTSSESCTGKNCGSNNNNYDSLRDFPDIYSDMLSSRQGNSPITDHHQSFSSSTRHIGESFTADGHSQRSSSSCRPSPPAQSKLFSPQQQRNYPPSSSVTGHQYCQSTVLSRSPPVPQELLPSTTFFLTQSQLHEFVQKSSTGNPDVISSENIKKASNSSQLYLLVPSNYPVLMTTKEEANNTSVNSEGSRVVTENTTAVVDTTRFGEARSTQNSQPLIDRFCGPLPVSAPSGQAKVVSTSSVTHKSSTDAQPVFLRSFKDVVPARGFRGLDILECTENIPTPLHTETACSGEGASSTSTLPHFSSIAYEFPPRFGETSCFIPVSSAMNPEDQLRQKRRKTSMAADIGSSLSLPHVFSAVAPRGSRLVEEEEEEENCRGLEMRVGPSMPLESSASSSSKDASQLTDSLLPTEVADSRNLFFTSNGSLTTRSRDASGRGGQIDIGDGDPKDIRRRVSHNEVERRRRDRINTWIGELYKLLPREQQVKSQCQSKGVVLRRVYEYFRTYGTNMKTLRERHSAFQQEIRRLKQENHILRRRLDAPFQQQASTDDDDDDVGGVISLGASSLPQQHTEGTSQLLHLSTLKRTHHGPE